MMKKILVIAPVLTCGTDISNIQHMLSLHIEKAEFLIIDPLAVLSAKTNQLYYQSWKKKLQDLLPLFDIVIGFSFGGVILQQNFSLFEMPEHRNKKIILFSTPSFSNHILEERLGAVIAYAKHGNLNEAHALLMQQVLYPKPVAPERLNIVDEAQSCRRLVEGLTRVLTTDSSNILSQVKATYTHFIGAESYLVNQKHLIRTEGGKIHIVPDAGMRVLQDNPDYCQHRLNECLS